MRGWSNYKRKVQEIFNLKRAGKAAIISISPPFLSSFKSGERGRMVVRTNRKE